MSPYFCRFVCLFVLLFNSQKFVISEDSENKLRISLLKIVTEEGSNRRINDRSNYVIEDLGLSYHFSFRSNSKCTEIAYSNDVLYQYDSSQGYPKALAVHLDLNQINLWLGDSVQIYQKTGDVWNRGSMTKIDDLSEDGLEVLISDGDSNSHRLRSGVSVNYYLNNVQCTEVKYKNQTVWKHGQNKNYPNRVYFNLFKQIALIIFPDSYMVLNYRENQTNLVSEVQIVRDSSSITVVTDNSVESSQAQDDVTKYQLKQYNFTSEYLFDDNSKCVELKHGDNVFWRRTDDVTLGYPKSLCFHRDLGILFLELKDAIYTYKCIESGCIPIKKIPLGGFSQSKLTIVTQSDFGSNPKNNDPSSFSEEAFGFGTEYVFNKGNRCIAIQYDGETLWSKYSTESESKLPKKVFFHIYTRMVILDFEKFYLVYRQENGNFHLITKDTLKRLSESDFKLMTNDGDKRIQLNRDHYDFVEYPYNYAFVYMLKDRAHCNAIYFRDTEMFSLPRENLPPKVMYVNWDMKMILLESPTFVNAYMYIKGKWEQIFGYPEISRTPVKLPGSPREQEHQDQGPQEHRKPEERRGGQPRAPEQPPNQPVHRNNTLRGSPSKPCQKGSDSSSNSKMTYILVSGSVVVVILLLLLAFAVFHYLK